MGLVEAVAGEGLDEREDFLGDLGWNPFLHAAGNELLVFASQGFADLFADGPAEVVGLVPGVAGQVAGDHEYLVGVDEHAVGLAQDRLKPFVEILGGRAAVLAVDVGGNVGHRAGAIERDDGGDFADAGGGQFAQRARHPGALHLEDSDGSAAPQQREGLVVVQRDVLGRQRLARGLLHKPQGVLDGAEVGEPKHIQLEQADLLDGLEGELRDRPAFSRAGEGYVFLKRVSRHDQAGGVGGGVAGDALDALGGVQQPAHGVVFLVEVL